MNNDPIWKEKWSEWNFKPWVKVLGYIVGVPFAILFWVYIISEYWRA